MTKKRFNTIKRDKETLFTFFLAQYWSYTAASEEVKIRNIKFSSFIVTLVVVIKVAEIIM